MTATSSAEKSPPPVLTRAEIRTRLAAVRTPRARGDGPLDSAGARPIAAAVPAAVLIPLIEHDTGFTILFTQRTAELKSHAGQISFPGGRCEPGDADVVAAALRETHEEIGLTPDKVEVLGRLVPYNTITGFQVTPIVGAIRPPLEVRPDPTEVAEIFEVPLAFFLDPVNHQRHSREFAGAQRHYHAMPYGERYIWGATAGMLLNLYDVLVGAL
jgi:8-oxo-dGTP pyrophosphatase MutT (NUDIX family)